MAATRKPNRSAAYFKRQNKYRRDRYANDPVYREREKQRNRLKQRKALQKPANLEKSRAKARAHAAKLLGDPDLREKRRLYINAYMNHRYREDREYRRKNLESNARYRQRIQELKTLAELSWIATQLEARR